MARRKSNLKSILYVKLGIAQPGRVHASTEMVGTVRAKNVWQIWPFLRRDICKFQRCQDMPGSGFPSDSLQICAVEKADWSS